MRPFGRFFGKPPAVELKRAAIEPVTILNRISDTRIRTDDFEITLPGHWRRVDKSDQLELVDQTETQQLIILKWTVPTLSDFVQLRRLVQQVANSKLEHLARISNGQARIQGSNFRESGRAITVRADAHDPARHVAITAALQADASRILSFSLYQTNLPQSDRQRRADAQQMLDSIKLQET